MKSRFGADLAASWLRDGGREGSVLRELVLRGIMEEEEEVWKGGPRHADCTCMVDEPAFHLFFFFPFFFSF